MKHKIALIGCGGMAKSHASRFEELLNRIEVTATVDIDLSKAQAVSELMPNKPPAFTDFKDALPLCDSVLLALPHHLHCEYTLACLNAGKNVLAEKPLGNSEEECLQMTEAAKANNKILMVAYCMRFHPLVIKMQELLQAETYGKLFQLSIWTEQHTERDPSNWMCRADQVGGGQLFSHGCHYIDLMLWMVGSKPVIGSHIGTNLGTPWMEREGTSNVSIKFENGALGYHFGTWGARGTKLHYSFQAHCEEGMLEIDYLAGKLLLHSNLDKHIPGDIEKKHPPKVLLEAVGCKPTAIEMAHFFDCIESGETPLTDPVSSTEGLNVIWKLYEAEDKNELADLTGIIKDFK
ncbi:MAG: Gfo/Idh/MocA family oxidoreductase [Victivallaceae bacterium]|nr:Gfo/Idh/MocA family oxidoreductase [Victivallaceae bacterium]